LFKLSVAAQTLSLADLYAGKLCAALDRQQPRDLFDLKLLLDNEGITEEIRKALVVYLASHDRPMHELLDPKPNNGRRIFDNEFAGMTVDPVTYEELIAARNTLNVPRKDVLRRFARSWFNFQISYRLLADEWTVYDNSSAVPQVIEQGP